jgi:zinc protease
VAALGGRENAFTTRDNTGYYQQIPANRLEDVMKLEADRFANNQWPDDEFKREIEVVKEERRMRTEDNPRAQLYEQLSGAMFQASPYRRPVVGWMSDLDAMTPQDARDFFQRWYVPANAAVVVAGDVDPVQVRRWWRSTTAASPRARAGAQAARGAAAGRHPPHGVQGAGRAVVRGAGLQGAAAALLRQDAGERRRAGADGAVAVLDGYEGARLDRALTKGPTAWPTASMPATACGAAGRSCSRWRACPPPGKTPEQVEAALRAEVARWRAKA